MRGARTLPLLRYLPGEVRAFAAMVMLVLGIGYGHALAYVYLTTRIAPAGIEQRFRGTPMSADTSMGAALPSEELEDTTIAAAPTPPATVTGDLEYQKSLAEMLNIIHTHILSMTFLFALSGIITLMTASTGTGFRKFVVIEPFAGILVTFLGLWLMRYVHPAFSWLVSISGITMAACFAGQCWAVIKEIRTASEL